MNISRIVLGLLLIVGAGGALATGTSAFFSDTESSIGNTFTAGSIDLKIDHALQTYNDDECQDGCVEVEGNLLAISGAGFEDPEVTNGDQWNIFDSPAGGWTVEWRSDIPATFGDQTRPTPAHLELHEGVLGSASEGDQYAELDTDWGGPGQPGDGEPASVTIYKNIPTVAGKKYMIRYAFAPRPNTPASDNGLEVRWGGNAVQTTGPIAGGGGPIAWQEYSIQVTATTTSTRVQFTDTGTANSLGSFLDNLRVQEMNCETVITNGQCQLWDEKDLADGDVFWDFDDVKPGDRGTNVISLHVFDNDAYACMMTDNVMDNENTPIDPEQDAGDNALDGVPNGELSDFLQLFIWGDTDGDGIFDNGESELYQGGFTGVAMERFPLQATTTAYLGSAWCFGAQTVNPDGSISCDGTNPIYNTAQTDILTTDLVFTAVQQRNNANFQCEPPEEPEEPEEPTFGSCSAGQQYADAAGTLDQGTQKSGASVLANRSAIGAAFGAPQTTGTPSDAGFPAGSFYSLGFKGAGPNHGSAVLRFTNNVVVNGAGADFRVYEVTGGSYPDENVRVEVSQNGIAWEVAAASATRDANVDIDGTSFEWISYVRLTDISNVALFPTDADAYDLDAIEALNCGVPQVAVDGPSFN
jgi:predicted ribosomally synthesized peptide with SipW-like signal peptide